MEYYTAYGLAIASEILIPEFTPIAPVDPDVKIRLGRVPENLPEPCVKLANWQARVGQFKSSFPGVANYLVEGGSQITVEPVQDGSPDQSVVLLSSAMAALLQQRGLLTLHASSVQTPMGAVLFSGRSGYGKSTLLAGFRKRGFKMISDDITALTKDASGQVVAIPSFGTTRLTEHAANHFDVDRENLQRTDTEVPKYRLNVEDVARENVPVKAICFLSVGSVEKSTMSEMSAKDAMAMVVQKTYRSSFLKGLGLLGKQFEMANLTVRQADVYELTRTRLAQTIDETEQAAFDGLGLGS